MNGLDFVRAYQKLAKHVVKEVAIAQSEVNIDNEGGDFEFSLTVHLSGCLIATPSLLTYEGVRFEFEDVLVTMNELDALLKK